MSDATRRLMLGNEAIARGAWEVGVRVATAYPGTPSTEITEFIATYPEIDAEFSVNEKVALEIGIGACIAGARSLVSMKHVGLNVAMDPLLSIAYPGVNAGLVVVVADDPGQHSSQNEQDTRYFGVAGKLPVLEPADSRECLEFVRVAFALSERFDTVVIVRLTTRVAHGMGLVQTHPREAVPLRAHDKRVGKYIVAPSFAKQRRIVAEQRLAELEAYAETTPLNRAELRGSKVGVVTSGMAYQYVREVAPHLSTFKLGLSYPVPRRSLLQFAAKHDELLVIEELEPIFEQKLLSYGIPVQGKQRVPTIGELSPEIVRAALGQPPLSRLAPPSSMELPVRPPVLCPGCHHRGPFAVLRKLKLHVCGDIGCYTLAAFPPLNSMETAICMGASVGMAYGYEKARGKEFAKKTVAVIGDSTFWHSGVTSLIDIVYGRGVSTVIILDNETTAMTGHQENPSTGKLLSGDEVPRIDFIAVAKAIGVNAVREVDAYDLEQLEQVIREEVERPEPSVIVTRRACLLRRGAPPKAPALTVDPETCNRCKRCIRLGCPAITLGDESASIDPTLCAGCGLCQTVCNYDSIHSSGDAPGDHE